MREQVGGAQPADVEAKGGASAQFFVGNQMGFLHAQGGPWSRFFARHFDLMVWSLVIALALELSLPRFSYETYLQYSQANRLIVGLFLLAGASLVNGVVSGVFGRSMGKAMFGLRAVPVDGRDKFNTGDHIVRELRAWIFGLALGIPFVALFTLWKNFAEVSVGRPALYDRQAAKIEVAPIGRFRRAVAMACCALVYAGFVALSVWGQANAVSATAPVYWTNPVTGRSVRIDGFAAEPMTLDDGSKVYTFAGARHIVYLAEEADPSGALTLTEYIEVLRASLTDVRHDGPVGPAYIDGMATQKWDGLLKSENWPGAFFVFATSSRFWRIIVLKPGASSSAGEETMPIVVALKRSIVP
jgi:uncharacterized RDD family membrane protein YckC